MVSGTNNEPNRFNENQWQNEYENKSTAINKIRASFRACLPVDRLELLRLIFLRSCLRILFDISLEWAGT